MKITVIDPGLFTCVQDAGRDGYQAFGMSPAGAMDDYSFAAANLLAGNVPGAAVLEMTLKGGEFRFDGPGLAAIAGADMGTEVDGKAVPNWSSFAVGRGSVLKLGFAKQGCRAYLAVAGGIAVPPVLGSRATYVKAGVGGLEGRAFREGDALETGIPAAGSGFLPGAVLPPAYAPAFGSPILLRVLLGPQDDHFTEEGIKTFLSSVYTIGHEADRMGYRLDGPAIRHRGKADIVSDALARGAVQVPGHGTPIVMMADRQTTGGYPKIAAVIRADQFLLAQGKPGDEVRFAACEEEDALAALRDRRSRMSALKTLLEG